MRTIKQLADQEVIHCADALIDTLAGTCNGLNKFDGPDLKDNLELLTTSKLDYESAARELGWTGPYKHESGGTYFEDTTDGQTWASDCWQNLCISFDIEPHEREICEHWIVTDWLADRLIERDETVAKDFLGFHIWGRTTSGQSISMDPVIEDIHSSLSP